MKAFGIACQIIQFLEKEGKKEEESAGPAVCLFLSLDDFAPINLVI